MVFVLPCHEDIGDPLLSLDDGQLLLQVKHPNAVPGFVILPEQAPGNIKPLFFLPEGFFPGYYLFLDGGFVIDQGPPGLLPRQLDH